jgi:hypothetical protein
MKHTRKKSIIAAALLALLTMSAGCVAYDDNYRYGRYDRWDRYSRVDLDRDGRVEQWERNRLDLDRDGRVERWERDRGPWDRYYYGGRYYDRYSDTYYRDRFDR